MSFLNLPNFLFSVSKNPWKFLFNSYAKDQHGFCRCRSQGLQWLMQFFLNRICAPQGVCENMAIEVAASMVKYWDVCPILFWLYQLCVDNHCFSVSQLRTQSVSKAYTSFFWQKRNYLFFNIKNSGTTIRL